MKIVTRVSALFARSQPVKRRLGQIQVPATDNFRHLLKEKCHE